jgi:hypothetical protein
MTLNSNAKVAGFAILVYLAAGIASMAVAADAGALLAVVQSFCALLLGVTFYVITRDQDPHLALVALGGRLIEAVPGHGEIYFAVGSTIFSWLLVADAGVRTDAGSVVHYEGHREADNVHRDPAR